MKKNILLFFVFPLLLSFITTPIKKTDWKEMGVKGKVKTIRETQYQAVEVSGKIQKGNLLGWGHLYIFNNKGNKTEENLLSPAGSPASKIVYTYDKDENKTEVNNYMSSGVLNSKITSVYNKEGLETERVMMDGGTLNWKTTYKYDSLGRKTEENIQIGDQLAKILYKYDAKGNLIEENRLQPNGSSGYKYVYKYDVKGNKIEMTNTVQSVLKNTYTYKYEFDKNGNWIKETEFDGGKASSISEREISYFNN